MKRKTLLVVDDEYLIRWALSQGLGERYRVVTASDVDEAMMKLQAEPVDAVITDLRMPVRSGMELVRYLRESRPDVKVFVISAVGSDDEFNRCFDLDVEAVLRKPIELPLIRRIVEIHLDDAPSPDPRKLAR